jgi:hypothetical protein
MKQCERVREPDVGVNQADWRVRAHHFAQHQIVTTAITKILAWVLYSKSELFKCGRDAAIVAALNDMQVHVHIPLKGEVSCEIQKHATAAVVDNDYLNRRSAGIGAVRSFGRFAQSMAKTD